MQEKTENENCIFCKIVAGEIPNYKVYEDENFLGFFDIHPVRKGHMLLITKHHESDILNLENNLYTELFLKAKELGNKIKLAINSPRVGIAVEGFGVLHVHVHLIPIDKENQINPNNIYTATKEELLEMQNIYTKSF